MKKFTNLTRIFAAILALVSLFTVCVSSLSISASAASTYATILENTGILKNEGTNKCYNRYAGGTYNGCKVTLWEYSCGDKDLWIKPISYNGGYKLFDYKERVVVSDVYRGSNSKAKAGMKIDVWCNQASENKFQIFLFERQSNGSYILRLQSQPNLVIGITKNKNGAQLQLVKYNSKDANQRWFFCDTNGKRLSTSQIEGTNNSSNNASLANIPSTNYKVNATYSIGTSKYLYCTVTKTYGTIAKGTDFFLNSNRTLVTNDAVLKKLRTILKVNAVRGAYIDTLNSMEYATTSVYSVASSWVRNAQVTKVLGVSSGASLKAIAAYVTKTPIGVYDSMATLIKEVAEPETSLAVTNIVTLKAISSDTIYWCNRAQALLSTTITCYDKAVEAATAISMASGNYAAAMWLGRPIVEEASVANPWTSTVKNLGASILEGCGFKTADALSKFENAVYLKDFLKSFKTTDKFNDERNQVLNALLG